MRKLSSGNFTGQRRSYVRKEIIKFSCYKGSEQIAELSGTQISSLSRARNMLISFDRIISHEKTVFQKYNRKSTSNKYPTVFIFIRALDDLYNWEPVNRVEGLWMKTSGNRAVLSFKTRLRCSVTFDFWACSIWIVEAVGSSLLILEDRRRLCSQVSSFLLYNNIFHLSG